MLLEKHGVQIRCTAVNAHCGAEYEAKQSNVPCEENHPGQIAIQGIELPAGLKRVSRLAPQLPDAIRKPPPINLSTRSVCVDIFPSGEMDFKIRGFDCCKWP